MRDNRSATSWSRRRFAGVVAGGVFGLALGARVARASGGPKILILGDSMIAGGFGVFLERDLRKEHGYDVARRGKSSTGLARPDFFNWIKEAQRLVDARRPDVSVVMFGGNDVQGLYMGKGTWIRWHEPEWKQEYARRIGTLCDILAPSGEPIYWVGLPIMRPDRFRQRVQRVNTIYRAEMAIRKGGTFLDTWDILADEDGEYADRIALEPASPEQESERRKRVRVRAGDGIHLSPAGAHHLKAHVLEQILPELENT